jgi:cell wall-associated NlpC family hydrolase
LVFARDTVQAVIKKWAHGRAPLRVALILTPVFLITACAPPGPRPAYSRESGTWVSFQTEDYSWTSPGEAGSPGAGSPSELRTVAESYLKTPYRYGGKTRKGMDCSGFVQQVFEEAYQMRLPRSSAAMARYGKDVDREDLQPGDLVFFKTLRINHVGIYMGDGYFIHSQSGIGVTYTRLDAPYFASHYAEAKRVVN